MARWGIEGCLQLLTAFLNERPNNGLQPAAAGAIMEPPRLKPGR